MCPPVLAVLPRAGVAVAMEKHPRRERPERRDRQVGNADHRRVAGKPHRDDDRQGSVDVAVLKPRVEAPQVLADLFDADEYRTARDAPDDPPARRW